MLLFPPPCPMQTLSSLQISPFHPALPMAQVCCLFKFHPSIQHTDVLICNIALGQLCFCFLHLILYKVCHLFRFHPFFQHYRWLICNIALRQLCFCFLHLILCKLCCLFKFHPSVQHTDALICDIALGQLCFCFLHLILYKVCHLFRFHPFVQHYQWLKNASAVNLILLTSSLQMTSSSLQASLKLQSHAGHSQARSGGPARVLLWVEKDDAGELSFIIESLSETTKSY
jgi:hypothetical protein